MATDADDILSQYRQLLQTHAALPRPVLKRTFMQICGYPHYENVCSNILAFFLQPDHEHGLGNLFLKAFFAAAGEECSHFEGSPVSVEREARTPSGKCLDLLIKFDGVVIGIENKIWAALYNDLEEYSRFVDGHCNVDESRPLKIVLSLSEISDQKTLARRGFKGVTYKRLFGHLKTFLGNHCQGADLKYLGHLNDFIHTIESLQGGNMQDAKLWAFFKDNSSKVETLIRDYEGFKVHLNGKIPLLLDSVKRDGPIAVKQWVYAKFCLVNDFWFPNGEVAVDTRILPSGWEITLFARPKCPERLRNEAAVALEQRLGCKFSLNQQSRFVVGSFSVDEEIGAVAERLNLIIDTIIALIPRPDGQQAGETTDPSESGATSQA